MIGIKNLIKLIIGAIVYQSTTGFESQFSSIIFIIAYIVVGEYLQGIAVSKSRKYITSLMYIRPDYANLKVGSEISVVFSEEISIGDVIVIKPGEKVSLDGIINAMRVMK